ncbi:MAG: hypothetical protein HUU22_15715 [Phycisphaerae bacterium]|nr:hypothetical protein [Phycisphaerae bacterium]NUQ47468.1 hypothetical protein [Phycisphaerae bacterium]
MTPAAMIIRRQNQYMRVFQERGATTPRNAQSLEELGLRNSWIFRRMVSRGVFLTSAGDRWFMSEAEADSFVRRRRWKLIGVVAVLLIIFCIYWFLVLR